MNQQKQILEDGDAQIPGEKTKNKHKSNAKKNCHRWKELHCTCIDFLVPAATHITETLRSLPVSSSELADCLIVTSWREGKKQHS